MTVNYVSDLPPETNALTVGDFWTDTGGTGGNQLYVWQGDYFVSASGSSADVTTADVTLTNPPDGAREGETTQEDANQNFHSRITEVEGLVDGGRY